jgi:VanZ family protein
VRVPDSPRSKPRAASIPAPLRVAAALYTLFLVYGCLLPLDFRPVPWQEAWSVYRHIPEFHPGRISKTDFIANVLLFIPLAFFWAGAIGAGWRRAGEAARSVAVWAGAVLLQAAIEFTQIYVPPRSVSLWDVIAGAYGAAAGVILWGIFGGRVRLLFARWEAARGRRGVSAWLVAPYALFLLLYNVLPADLNLGPEALYHKWKRGFIQPIPFSFVGHEPVTAALGIAAESILWMPLPLLLLLGTRLRAFRAWGLTLLLAMAIEAVQVLVQSRVSDASDLVCAALGAGAGVWLGMRYRRSGDGASASAREAAASTASAQGVFIATALAAVAWTWVLVTGFCYPFDFVYDPAQIAQRADRLLSLPIHAPWLWGRSMDVAEILTRMVLFAPFGLLVSIAAGCIVASWARRAGAVASFLIAGGVAGGIEVLQVYLPARMANSADIAVGAIGGVVGYVATSVVRRTLERGARWAASAPERGERPRSGRP